GHGTTAQPHFEMALRARDVAGGDASAPPSLHIIEESYFAEIIDPATGASVADGATGELVLTPLGARRARCSAPAPATSSGAPMHPASCSPAASSGAATTWW
ncbi:MAG: hypothetical protein ABMA01_24860, partial [Chthoniobacteraceae bacterium]